MIAARTRSQAARRRIALAGGGLFAALTALTACKLLTIEVEEDASTVVEGAGLLGSVLGVVDLGGLDDFDVAIAEELADQGVDPGDLRSVVITRFTFEGDPDLGFLSSLVLYVSADGVPEVEVGSLGDLASGTRTAELALTGVDLADAVTAGAMQFRIDASGQPPADDTDVTVHVVAEVTATPQGACHAAKEGR